jgi:hypothetical protein
LMPFKTSLSDTLPPALFRFAAPHAAALDVETITAAACASLGFLRAARTKFGHVCEAKKKR